MPDSRMIYKAGKLSFLLVCLFLCTACGGQKAVFKAGTDPAIIIQKETTENREKVTEEIPEPENEPSAEKLININTADASELMILPGIGEVKAAAIIEYREREGAFEKNEDIMNVKGIGTGTFSKINSLICVK